MKSALWHYNYNINRIPQDTYNYIKYEPEFTFESRGKIQAKGKGEVEMYFVSRNFSKG
ncbi:MAG: hypothetical protein R2812_06085 [Gelidibacter sp.]|nr:hypothetical protein [Gelidibacter sp.]